MRNDPSTKRKKYNRKRELYTKYFAAAVCVLILILLVKIRKQNILSTQQIIPVTTATEYASVNKKFVSVEVMQGDTLWSIARANKTGNYTTKALVEEIKTANGLKSDKIIVGKHLIVPYYD